jgi:hypothetical protein
MLTESDARHLLQLAAETIEVEPAIPRAPRPSRRGRNLVAIGSALAVAATVAVVFTLAKDRNAGPTPAPPIDSPAFQLEDDQIPSVFAMTGDQAQRALADRGLTATVQRRPTCEEVPGRALGTEPATGSRFQPGDRVSVLVASTPATAACKSLEDRALAWEFLDWANGRGQPPPFADAVSSYTNGEGPVSFDSAAAMNPATWGADAAPAVLARSSAEVMPLTTEGHTEYLTPVLGVATDDGRDFVCGGWDLPSPLDRRRSITVGVGVPTDGIDIDCMMINLFVTHGRLDTVVLRRWDPADAGPPNSHSAEPDSDDVSADAERVGATFVAFARGNAPSGDLFAPEVELWLGNMLITTIEAESADTDSAWEICPPEGDGYAEAVCPFSALEAVRESKWPVIDQALHPDLGACAAGDSDAELPSGSFVVLGVAEPDACLNNWNVELDYGADRRINAVNLLLGSP